MTTSAPVDDRPSTQSVDSHTTSSAQTQRGFAATLLHTAPTLVVMTLLAAIAWWGHHTGWALPKFSELFSGGRASAADDWCAEHAVPESVCVECNPSLMPKSKSTWCRKHGVHNCLFEHPELAQLKTPAVLGEEDRQRAERALALKDRPENTSKCKTHLRRIQFASQEAMDKMGIDIMPVFRGPVVETVSASGEIQFEQPRVATVSSAVTGRVRYVTEKGQIGAAIKRGDLLALVDAVEVGKAKSELLQALAQLDLKNKYVENLKPLVPVGAVPQARLLEAEGAQREAQIRVMGAQQTLVNLGLALDVEVIKSLPAESLARHIQFFGIPDAITRNLDPRTTSANFYPILAPRDGIVTAAKVVAGEVVDVSKPLFIIADTSMMWLILNVRNEDVKYLKIRGVENGQVGQTVLFRPDGSDDEVNGELVWKSASVDERTRTVPFRAEVPNPQGKLLANNFGMGRIVLRADKNALVVPNEALHWEGDCNIVFVRDKHFMEPGAPKVFHVRSVRPGVRNGANTEIIAGLMEGEVIATRNSANLRAELLKNNLGAG